MNTRRTFLTSSAAAAVSAPLLSAQSPEAAPKKNLREIETDVLVCGGGCAGTTAALSAARAGAKTLLVEKAPFAGGIITNVGLPYFDGISNIKDFRVVVKGIALELLAKTGVCKPDATHIKPHNPTIPNTFEFKVLLDRELQACGEKLKVLFNSVACDAESSGGRITSVTIANKDGLVRIRPKVVIDCTGDADVAAWAGAPTEQSAEVQPLTLHFRIGHVQPTKGISALCRTALINAQQRGELPHFYGPGVGFTYGKDEVYIHGVRVPANPTDAADLSRAEMQGRADALAMFHAWKAEVPAFKDSYFIESYPWIGVRESRRLIGQHVLNEDDIMKGHSFDDAIATGCWYLDLHPNKTTLGSANDFQPEKVQPAPYDIPYRSLLPQKIENLLVAGRCHSATRGAHASTRVTVTAMAMGEAAGCAAALALQSKAEVATLNGQKVREALTKVNAGPFTQT
ncbi:FAD dependent oxidoreductase [Roseimicrobium gellanilyticum]|uniref:FAD dependent oxidoreductase n=1 Tax=Roseimicrobium gellanilyticum TaxID=748857 RepID=A0A366HUK3_9BACT|nr:FAD-dependent oxidoreductase [Roseimicrobium gellanilyticum]RBP47530.1 FAD dependent oxidoreductase [Roseimicrobium gellanilyticum]